MKNREIKFRAWNKHQKVFHYFGIEAAALEDGAFGKLEFADLEFLQFTGLKDRNGVEIYEGDILRQHFNEDTLEGWFWLTLTEEEKKNKYIDKEVAIPSIFQEAMPDEIEVIGNIYENPELLK